MGVMQMNEKERQCKAVRKMVKQNVLYFNIRGISNELQQSFLQQHLSNVFRYSSKVPV